MDLRSDNWVRSLGDLHGMLATFREHAEAVAMQSSLLDTDRHLASYELGIYEAIAEVRAGLATDPASAAATMQAAYRDIEAVDKAVAGLKEALEQRTTDERA